MRPLGGVFLFVLLTPHALGGSLHADSVLERPMLEQSPGVFPWVKGAHNTLTEAAPDSVRPSVSGDQVASSHADSTSQACEGDATQQSPLFLAQITVTATRSAQDLFSLSRSATVATILELQRESSLSLLDFLDDRVGIWIEKRTSTNSDPVIRGLSGGNVLALVGGNSLTTFWGEGGFAGDDMYGKVEAESIERIEVVRGPSSVLYGANALGGVINFFPKDPPLYYTDGPFEFGAKLKAGVGTADGYHLGRFELYGANRFLRYYAGYSIRDVGDVRVGGGRVVVPSGGEDRNFDLVGEARLAKGQYLGLTTHIVNRPEVYRSYRPTQVNRNDRDAFSLEYRADERFAFADELKISGYYQNKKDKREWTTTEMIGVAKWETYAAGLQADKNLQAKHGLTWGLHFCMDDAESPDDEQFTITTPETGKQKAAPDTRWRNYSAYIQEQWNLNHWLRVTGSARYDHFDLVADNNVFYTIPGSTAPENVVTRDPGQFNKTSVTGGASLTLRPSGHSNFVTSWYRGYRLFAPNFGLRQLGYGLLAPNGLLDPIIGDTYEVSLRMSYRAGNLALTAYYTDFSDFQQPVPGSYEGMTSFDFDGSGTIEPDENIYVVASNGDAYVRGVEVEGEYRLGRLTEQLQGFCLGLGLMWNHGREEYPGAAEEPLRHTHPMRGLAKLRWEDPDLKSGRWAEFTADLVGNFDQVSDSRLHHDVGYLVNPQDPSSGLIRDYGLPGYSVFDIRGGFRAFDRTSVMLALENVFDKKYRSAHSRMDAYGRNLRVAVEVELK